MYRNSFGLGLLIGCMPLLRASAQPATTAQPTATAPVTSAPYEELIIDRIAEAWQLEREKRLEEAARLRREVMATVGTDEERFVQGFQLTLMYLRPDDHRRGAQALRDAIEYLPPYDPRYWQMAETLTHLYFEPPAWPGDAITWLETLTQGLEPGRGDLRAWTEYAMALLQMGDTERACGMLRDLLRAVPTDPDRLLRRVRVGLDLCRDAPSGRVHFNETLEATALINQFRTRLSERRWDEALSRLAELLTRFPDVRLEWPGTAGTGPRRIVAELMATMPPEARTHAQQAQAAMLESLLQEGHSERLARFLFMHPWPGPPSEVVAATGDALAAEGRFSRAAACYRAAAGREEEGADRSHFLIKAARCAAYAGEPPPAELPNNEPIRIAGNTMTASDALSTWRAEADASAPAEIAVLPLSAMKHQRLRLQQKPLAFHNWEVGWQPGRDRDNARMLAIYTPAVLAGDHRQVFLNTTEMLYAIDPVAQRLLWTRSPSDFFQSRVGPQGLSGRQQLRLTNVPKQSYVSTSNDSVFFRFTWGERASDAPRSVLFAARRTDGALLWTTERIPELAGLRFASDPAYADGTVVAATWEPRDLPIISLVGLDAVTGELLWKTQLFSGLRFPSIRRRTETDIALGSPPPTIQDGRVYFTACMGVLACASLFDGQVQWLQEYPQVLEYGPDQWASGFFVNRPTASSLVRGETVLVAPQDSRGVLFFNAADGRLLRSYQSFGFRVLIGADEAHAYIQEDGRVACVRISDASISWKTELPTRTINGAPVLSPRGIVCATGDGIFVLSPVDGQITEHRPRLWSDPIGNPFDLKDRLLAVSSSAIHVLAQEVHQGENWCTPRSPAHEPLHAEVAPVEGIVRWALPAPDRDDFFLSARAPELMVVRNWESFELRRTGPAPTLLWDYPSWAWPSAIQFDPHVVLLTYSHGLLIAVDVETGQTRFEIKDDAMISPERSGAAIPVGDLALWFTNKNLRAIDLASGAVRWTKDWAPNSLAGVCPRPEGIGVYLHESGAVAALLDARDGKEVRRIPLQAGAIQCIPPDQPNAREASTCVLLGGRNLAVVDFATGEVRSTGAEFKIPQQITHLVLQNGYLSVRCGAFGTVGVFRLPTLEARKHHGGYVTCVADDVQYYAYGPRVFAHDMDKGAPIWQSGSLSAETTFIGLAGKYLLTVQDLKVDKDRSWYQVSAIRRDTGEVVQTVPGLALNRAKAEMLNGELYLSDTAYCYRIGPPVAADQPTVRIEQTRADPDAIAALKIARDQTAPPAAPPAGKCPMIIDGDLGDWQPASWGLLGWPGNWLPDHTRLAPWQARRPTDLSSAAGFAIAQDERRVYVAVRVLDALHDADWRRPFWCGDSVSLTWRPAAGQGSQSLVLTGALVDHVPCLERGSCDALTPILPDVTIWPEWLRLVQAGREVPWLRRWENRAARLSGVQFAARRDEAAGETRYEWSIPVDLLPGPRGTPGLLWDLQVHAADGRGRLGELSLGSSRLQMREGIGLARWPALAEASASATQSVEPENKAVPVQTGDNAAK